MRRAGLVCALTMVLALATPVSAGEEAGEHGPIELQTVTLPGDPDELVLGDVPISLRNVRIRLGEDRWLRLRECDGGLCAGAMPRGPLPERLPGGGVVGTRLVKAKSPFLEVWLADAVEREGTGVLPGPLAGAVVGRDRKGRDHRFDLPLDEAIETVAPRLADLDGDGADEIIVTTVRAGAGGVLTVLTHRESGLAISWQSEAASPGVWRDAVAVADFDGDQIPEIATVTAGDEDGRLEIWRRDGNGYALAFSLKGFASHVPGTRTAGVAVATDMDGDGIADLVVPARDRRSLRVVSMAGGEIAEPYRIELPGEVVTAIGALAVEGRKRPILVAGVAGGILVLAR